MFDMYAGISHEVIDHHEEYLLSLAAAEPDRYPQLSFIESHFSENFVLQPTQAGALSRELAGLLEHHRNSSPESMPLLVMRLRLFFQEAVRNNLSISCEGQ